MLRLGGLALVEQLCAQRPEMRVLFMSGYAGDNLSRHGLLDQRAVLLPKPFTAEELTQKVRAALDSPTVFLSLARTEGL